MEWRRERGREKEREIERFSAQQEHRSHSKRPTKGVQRAAREVLTGHLVITTEVQKFGTSSVAR